MSENSNNQHKKHPTPEEEIEAFHKIQNDIDQSITEKSKILAWVNTRLPIISGLENTLRKHPYPKN